MNAAQRNAIAALLASIDAAAGVGPDMGLFAHVAGPTRGRCVVRLPPGTAEALRAALAGPQTAVTEVAATPVAPDASEAPKVTCRPGGDSTRNRFRNLEMD